MKVLVVICISEYADQLHKLFQSENISPFFETNTTGFNLSGKVGHRLTNWFGHGNKPLDGVLNFALIGEQEVERILQRLKDCNECKGEADAVFAFTLNIDQVL